METRESLGKRLGRFVALMGILFVVTTAVVVTQRLSQDSLALLVGLACGVGVMLPTVALALLLWRREELRQPAGHSTPMNAPPVVVVTPQALPGYGMQPPAYGDNTAWQWNASPAERTFTIVGGEE